MNRCNKKGRQHGYWEFKHSNGKVCIKYAFNNRIYLGYEEWYNTNGNGKIRCKQISI